jgi:hypothetical protein
LLSLLLSPLFSTHVFAQSILDIPDVDGDGVVTERDISHIANRRDYHPLFDINADGTISDEDAAEAKKYLGHKSSKADQEIVKVIEATMKYYGPNGLENAKRDGFIPVVANARGHGVHWAHIDRMNAWIFGRKNLDLYKPEGLLYTTDGQLYGVHYVKVVPFFPSRDNFFAMDQKQDYIPRHFTGISNSNWHTHMNVCGTGVGSATHAEDPVLIFEQDVPGTVPMFPSANPSEAEICATRYGRISVQEGLNIIDDDKAFALGSSSYGKSYWTKFLRWQAAYTRNIPGKFMTTKFIPKVWPLSDLWFSPKVYMLHGWFHSLNPNGRFAGEHPGIAPNAPPLPSRHGHHH